MSIEALKNSLPDYAKDLKLNLSSLANEPVLTEQQTGANPKNVGGPGASKVSGPASVATKKP